MKEVSLTISGGGIRSSAALGVIKYLEENNIKIKALSGNSGGAMIALLYSYGISTEEILHFIKNIDKFKLFRPTFNSFFSLYGLQEQLELILKDKKRIIPLTVVTTNLNTMKANYHSEGSLIKETIASGSIYKLFPPILLNDELHVDGLYVDNLPNKFLVGKELKNISINVNNPSLDQDITKRLYKIKEKSGIMCNASLADIFLDFYELTFIRLLDLSSVDKCIKIGYEKAKREIGLSQEGEGD